MLSGCFRNSLGAGKVISTNQYGHMACILCQKYRFLRSCKATSHYKNFFPAEKLSVTGRAISNSMSSEFCLSRKAYHSRMGSRCKKYSEALIPSLIRRNFPYLRFRHLFRFFQCQNLTQPKLCSEMFSLFAHGFCQFFSAGFLNPRIIYNFIGDCNLATKLFFFYHKNTIARPRQI